MSDAPNRAERQACWNARDAYFGCLDAHQVLVPGTESSNTCYREEAAYTKDCIKSWVEYFSKARVAKQQIDFTMKGQSNAYVPHEARAAPGGSRSPSPSPPADDGRQSARLV